MASPIGTIRVETRGSARPLGWRVFLDGQDISHFVRGLVIHGHVDHEAQVHLELVGCVELPDELKALVTATLVTPAKLATAAPTER